MWLSVSLWPSVASRPLGKNNIETQTDLHLENSSVSLPLLIDDNEYCEVYIPPDLHGYEIISNNQYR